MKSAVLLVLIASTGAKCPSALSPGEHKISLQVRFGQSPPNITAQSLQVGSMERDFFLMVPEDMPAQASPGIVMIHGCGGSAEKFEMESLMNQNAAAKKWYSVYPQGSNANNDENRLGWSTGPSNCGTNGVPNDVDFMVSVPICNCAWS
jgi:poly(3-hydroxybutyrate) depolymerase